MFKRDDILFHVYVTTVLKKVLKSNPDQTDVILMLLSVTLHY